ncbi:MAG: hypothetical protein LBG88_00360 [Christensenellaceae bacterium]|nr:hypothetical protein [Christensenellaceae bacterium]
MNINETLIPNQEVSPRRKATVQKSRFRAKDIIMGTLLIGGMLAMFGMAGKSDLNADKELRDRQQNGNGPVFVENGVQK